MKHLLAVVAGSMMFAPAGDVARGMPTGRPKPGAGPIPPALPQEAGSQDEGTHPEAAAVKSACPFGRITFKASIAKAPYVFKDGKGWSRRMAEALIQLGDTQLFVAASVSITQMQENGVDQGEPELKVTLPTISIGQGAARKVIFLSDDEETQLATADYLRNAAAGYLKWRAGAKQSTTPVTTTAGVKVSLKDLGLA